MSRHPMHEANRRGWDAASAGWQAEIDARMDWRSIPDNIHLAMDDIELNRKIARTGRALRSGTLSGPEHLLEQLAPHKVVGMDFVDALVSAVDGPSFVGPGED